MIKKLLSIVLLHVCFLTTSFCQKNITLLGNLKFPGNTLAGVWHYANGTGEYALVGTHSGLSVVDVTIPASPVLLFDIPAAASLWREVKTFSHYAYVTTEGGGGITIVDLDSLPLAVNYKTYTGDGIIAGLLDRAHSLQIEGNYLYINGPTGLANGGVLICSLADPWNPVYIGMEDLRYCHDSYIRNDTLWASEVFNGQFTVFDITDKTSPVQIVTQPTPGAFNHNGWLSDNGRYFFTTDEQPFTPLGVFDVSDLSNIKLVDTYYTNLNPTAEVHNVRVLNDFLINPSYGNNTYGSQLTICDAARPENIIETGNYPLGGITGGLSISWDATPYLPSGIILATDLDSGLFILSPTYTRACYLEGIVTDGSTGALLNHVTVSILATAVLDSTNLTGEYKTGLADPGSYSVMFTKAGYFPKTVTNVSLTNGNLTTLNVQLWDITVGLQNFNNGSLPIKINPNPIHDFAVITFPNEYKDRGKNIKVIIEDVFGRRMIELNPDLNAGIKIDMMQMNTGIYMYAVYENNILIQSGKLLKE